MTSIFERSQENSPLESVVSELDAILSGNSTKTGTSDNGNCIIKKEYGVYQITTVIKGKTILFMVEPLKYTIRVFKKGKSSGRRKKKQDTSKEENDYEYVPAQIDSIDSLEVLRNRLAEFQF